MSKILYNFCFLVDVFIFVFHYDLIKSDNLYFKVRLFIHFVLFICSFIPDYEVKKLPTTLRYEDEDHVELIDCHTEGRPTCPGMGLTPSLRRKYTRMAAAQNP